MATIDTIKANIIAAVPEITSTSNAALFLKIAEAIAISLDNTFTEMSNTLTIIDEAINTQRYGKAGYYIEKALYYQVGDSLVENPDTLALEYAVIDVTKHLVVQASFEDIIDVNLHSLVLKVAKLDTVNNVLIQLTTAELAAFSDYMLNFEIVGLPLNITSLPANELSFDAVITYYASSDLTSIQSNVIAAMNDFRDNFTFDGLFYVNDLESYLKTNVVGIRNVSLSNTLIDGVAFSNKTSLISGYFNYLTPINNGTTPSTGINISYEAI